MVIATAPADKLNLFISYSRDDLAFADQLDAALKHLGYETTLDRHSISGGEDWKIRLGTLIRDADTVVFVVSPSAATSEICAWEVSEAQRLGKRIVPVVCQPLGTAAAPAALSQLNYIYFYDEPKQPGSGFGTGLVRLANALDTDLDWLREHTRLLQRASEWQSGQQAANRLLSGADITAAKSWVARRPKDAPAPTELHLEFIQASEDAEHRRQDERQTQLEERERLLNEAETSQRREAEERAARESAQQRAAEAAKREAAQARRVTRVTLIGLVAAVGLAIAAGAAMLFAREETAKAISAEQRVRAANTRLSAKMKLSIALLDQKNIVISENWYRLATTNAASVVLVHGALRSDVEDGIVGSGFVFRGKDLHASWGDELMMLSAGHLLDDLFPNDKNPDFEARDWSSISISVPAADAARRVGVNGIAWRSKDSKNGELTTQDNRRIDIVAFRLRDSLPDGVVPVVIPTAYDFSSWPSTINPQRRQPEQAARSLLSIGYVQKQGLTLSISRAIGRYDEIGTITKVFYSDATGIGSSGTPVFDANTGELVAVEQAGQTGVWAAGIPIVTVREVINRSLAGGPLLLKTGPKKPHKKPAALSAAASR